jgi:hypothetical protein
MSTYQPSDPNYIFGESLNYRGHSTHFKSGHYKAETNGGSHGIFNPLIAMKGNSLSASG